MSTEFPTRDLSTNVRPIPRLVVSRDGSGAAEATASRKTIRDYFRVVFNYPWLIAGTTLLVVSAATLYCFLATRLYTAQVTLRIGTYSPLLANAGLEDVLRQQTREQDYTNTQIEILSSLSLADRVLSDPGVGERVKEYLARDRGLFSVLSTLKQHFAGLSEGDDGQQLPGAYRHTVKELEKYKKVVTITPRRKTSLVTVAVTTSDPQLSAQLANTHAELFIDLVRSDRQKSTVENLIFLQNQAQELGDRVATLERNLGAYAEENAIVSINKDDNITVKRMSELNQLLTEATAKRIKSESTYKEAMTGSGLNSAAFDDESIKQLRLALKEAEGEYAMLSEKFTSEYPRMVQLKGRIDALKENLRQQREQVVRGLEASYKADLESEKKLQEELEIQKSSAFDLSRREIQYNILKREYDSTKDLHQAVLRQLKEAQVSSESSGTNISVTDQAAVPLKPSSPKPVQTILLSLAFGLFGGVGMAFLLEAVDNTMKTPDDVMAFLNLPTLGVVPEFRGDTATALRNQVRPALVHDTNEAEKENVPAAAPTGDLVTVNAPGSIASEAFRSVRTGIILSSADTPIRRILVTSGAKSEGKTTVGSNLGAALAQSSMRTIIVDADLRRPAVHRSFSADNNGRGLVDFLTGQCELDEVIVKSSVENLFYIPAGSIPPNPAELVGSKKMEAVLDLLSAKFDYVLIDSPPILPVTDAVLLSRKVDGVVLVVRGNETLRYVAQEAATQLRQAGARILGVVLNDVDIKRGDYYFYYRNAYSYYMEDEKPSRRRARAAKFG